MIDEPGIEVIDLGGTGYAIVTEAEREHVFLRIKYIDNGLRIVALGPDGQPTQDYFHVNNVEGPYGGEDISLLLLASRTKLGIYIRNTGSGTGYRADIDVIIKQPSGERVRSRLQYARSSALIDEFGHYLEITVVP